MAAAEVGDDVYGEDPTINRLEERAAEIFGREAAVFVPTGTMGNQIAIRLHTRQGQEIICESRSHILDWEMATAASFSGCLIRPVVAPRGVLTWAHIEPVIYARGSTFHASNMQTSASMYSTIQKKTLMSINAWRNTTASTICRAPTKAR